MNRAREYSNFAGWFAGLGYVAMWPVTSADLSGRPFGASIFCQDSAPSVMDLLCHTEHPLQLPAALHLLGSISALFVTIRLLILVIRRARRRSVTVAAAVPIAPLPAAIPRLRKPAPPPRPVKPRTQFGLRGTPR